MKIDLKVKAVLIHMAGVLVVVLADYIFAFS
jgi:hypothetical protein